MSKTLTFSLILVSLIVGLGGGYFLSPYYTPYSQSESSMSSHFGTVDRWVDLRYIDKMIAHHRGAILMAKNIEAKTDRQEIKDLVQSIYPGETKLIDELYSWKKAWYNDYTVVRDPVVPNFGAKDDKADLRFLNALIAHHQLGIDMTKEIRIKSSRTEIINNADGVEKFLTETKAGLTDWRKTWYQI